MERQLLIGFIGKVSCAIIFLACAISSSSSSVTRTLTM